MECLIGVDLGTTSLKAVLLTVDGQRLAETSAPYPTQRPGAGLAEQDPQDWWRLLMDALRGFEGLGKVRALCITSQVNTHVFVDAALNVLHPAIVWQDGRAAAAGAEIDTRLTLAEKIAALGAPIPVDASHALARMNWMVQTHPAIWAQTAHVLLPRDYLLARLTGQGSDGPDVVGGLGRHGFDLCCGADGPDVGRFIAPAALGGPFVGGGCGASGNAL